MPKSKHKTENLKLKGLLILSLFIFYILSFKFNSALAQYRLPGGSLKSTVSATLGDFYLNLSGYITPFASIVLTSEDVYLRATTSDQFGYFRITEVLIKKGFSKFCFDAFDFRRLGESYSCTSIPPAQAGVTLEDIFLPPTLGLSRSEIKEGASATAYGYSMPQALVTLTFAGRNLTTKADQAGYYQFVLKDVKAGVYQLSASAELEGKKSLLPLKKLTLKSLSPWEQFIAWLKNLWKKIVEFFTSLSFGPLWIAIPIIILIIILLWKLRPARLVFRHPLHHKYFMGY